MSVKGVSLHRLNCKTVIEYALLLLICNLVSVEENLRNSPSPHPVSSRSCRGEIKWLWAECRRIILVIEAVRVWVRDYRSVNSTPPRLNRYTQRNDCRINVTTRISLASSELTCNLHHFQIYAPLVQTRSPIQWIKISFCILYLH
jgi:hypothetical protein